MRTRAYRRHHDARMVQRAKRKFKQWGEYDDWIEWLAPRFADNMAKCSCESCGNPRRHFNQLTLQELRSRLNELDGG